jgi:hypothetical protein
MAAMDRDLSRGRSQRACSSDGAFGKDSLLTQVTALAFKFSGWHSLVPASTNLLAKLTKNHL